LTGNLSNANHNKPRRTLVQEKTILLEACVLQNGAAMVEIGTLFRTARVYQESNAARCNIPAISQRRSTCCGWARVSEEDSEDCPGVSNAKNPPLKRGKEVHDADGRVPSDALVPACGPDCQETQARPASALKAVWSRSSWLPARKRMVRQHSTNETRKVIMGITVGKDPAALPMSASADEVLEPPSYWHPAEKNSKSLVTKTRVFVCPRIGGMTIMGGCFEHKKSFYPATPLACMERFGRPMPQNERCLSWSAPWDWLPCWGPHERPKKPA